MVCLINHKFIVLCAILFISFNSSWAQCDQFNLPQDFHKCLSRALTALDSADIYMLQGTLCVKSGKMIQARESFQLAIRTDPNRIEALVNIGDLYFNSFKSCARKINIADDRMVYLVAYDYYYLAGDSVRMELARKGFPSIEEISDLNYYVGMKVRFGCWINENTILRTRD